MLTKPPNTKDDSKFWDFKESTVREFVNLGVPLRPAEVAAIDLKKYIIMGLRNKLTPKQTAKMMLSEVERIYRNENGAWYFGGKA